MMRTLEAPDLKFSERIIPKNHRDILNVDILPAREVAEPLFAANVNTIGFIKRLDYQSGFCLRPYHSLTLLLQGEMTFEWDGTCRTLIPGDLACMPAGVCFDRTTCQGKAWFIHVQLQNVQEWEPIHSRGPYCRPYESASLMALLLRDMLDAKGSPDLSRIPPARASARKLLHMLRQEVLSSNRSLSRHSVSLRRLLGAISQSPDLPWERKDMASLMNLSVRQMTKVFRRELGVSPHALVVRQRMALAVDQLINTTRPIKAISTGLGYDSLHSFTRLFTKNIGMAPGRYRKEFGSTPETP